MTTALTTPLAQNNPRALYMNEIPLPERGSLAIPREYRNAAADWLDYGHEQDGVLKLAHLLFILDTKGAGQ